MATAELLIAFDARIGGLETSLKRVTTALQNMKNTTDSTVKDIDTGVKSMNRSITGLIGGVRGLVAAWGIMKGLQISRDVILAADDLNTSIRRLGSITQQTMPAAVSQFNSLLTIAQRTGQPVNDLTNSYTRFYTATRSIGATAAQVTQFTSAMASFAQISGQGPQEAASAINQLAQGLASGRLQGDELKSIMENMPQLATALARELGVTVGQLREMGEQGKLTAENVFPAIVRAGQALQAQLTNMPLSLRQAWVAVENAATSMVAAIDRRIGASQYLAQFLAWVAGGMQGIGTRAEGTGEGAPRVARVANLNREMEAARENAAGLRRQLDLIEQWQNADARGRIALRRDNPNIAATVSGSIPPAELRTRLAQEESIVRNHRQTLDEIGQAADEEEIAARRRGNNERASQQASADTAFLRTVNESGNKVLEARREHAERLTRIETAEINARRVAVTEGGETLQQVQTRFNAARAASAATMAREIASATAGERAAASAAARETAQQAAAAGRAAEQARTEMTERLRGIIRQGDQGMEQIREVFRRWQEPLSSGAGEQGAKPNAFDTFFERAAGGGENVATGIRAIATVYSQAATQIVRDGGTVTEALAAVNAEIQRARDRFTGAGGDGAAFDQIVDTQMGNAARIVRQASEKITDSFREIAVQGVKTFSDDLAGSIIDFATTGEQKFDEMAANFAKNIAKMILQLMIFNAIKAGLGPGGLNMLEFRQAGGPVMGGGSYIVGEAGPELFVPGSSGNIVPNHALGGSTVVNVFNQAPGTTTRQQERSNGMGGKEIDIYIEQVVQRGMTNGRFDNALGTSFGASRTGRV
jgi:tape measure domain-containing protein